MHLPPGLANAPPFLWTLLGLLVGVVAEAFVLPPLQRSFERRGRLTAARMTGALRGPVTIWAVAAGVRATLLADPGLRTDVSAFVLQALTVASIVALTMLLARVAGFGVGGYLRRRSEAIPSASLFTSIAVLGIWAIGLLVILSSLGIAVTPVLTALGVGGLAVALALKDTLENLFAGLQIVASNQLRPGDYIKLESGSEGYVADVTWRNTTVRDLGDNLIVVPNSKLAQSTFVNYALPQRELTVSIPILVPYDADLIEVERIALETAQTSPAETRRGVENFAPYVRFQEFGNENVKGAIFLRTAVFSDQFVLRSDYIKRFHSALRAAGIRAPFPAQTAPPPAPKA
ncbi:MAG: mechanosensitive ion channel family protein [Candidatus Eremiobacteraeota bacterium]|nr:mechanosensitive ion channel family protein [Candidatus Eremiobacteraeota bacterium]